MTKPVEGARRGRPRLLPDAPSERYALRLPSDLLARLHDEANKQGTSTADVVRLALRRYLDRAERR